ncbi:tRNA endonuclease ANKZF1 isoform 2-T2 [Sylvia borin]
MPESRSVFEAAQDPELLHGLTLVTGVAVDAGAAELAPVSHEKPAAPSCEEKAHGVTEVPEKMCCLTCGQVFGSREEQTEHYRLDWHRFNLKQRLLGRRTLPAEVFEEKTRTGDVSSISGSDSDSSGVSSESELLPSVSDTPRSPQIPRSHKVLFRNAKGQLISAYRCVLVTGKASHSPAFWERDSRKAFRCRNTRLFTATRCEHGEAQPRACGMPRPQGQHPDQLGPPCAATTRLHCSRIFRTSWQPGHSTWMKLSASSSGPLVTTVCCSSVAGTHPCPEGTLASVTSPSAPAGPHCERCCESMPCWPACRCMDTPLEDITGSPKKVWQKRQQKVEVDPLQEDTTAPEEEEEEEEESPAGELETVEVTLETLHLREFEVMPKQNRKRRKKRDKKVEKGPCAEETGYQCEQPGLEPVTELQGEAKAGLLPWSSGGDPQTQLCNSLFTACKTGDVRTLRHLLGVPENGVLPGDSEDGESLDLARSLLNQPVDERGCTLLHVAARAGKAEAVCLLLEAGADPALRDRQERTPYCVSADRLTRNTFRKFMVDHPDKYDYSRAKVPGPLTQEMEAKKLEKKRAYKAQRKQREQAQREEQRRWEQEQENKQRFAALSDREKRALAAERRLAAQLQDTGTTPANISRCWQCGESLLGRIPFHYLDFSFCSTACLQTHRRAQAGHI